MSECVCSGPSKKCPNHHSPNWFWGPEISYSQAGDRQGFTPIPTYPVMGNPYISPIITWVFIGKLSPRIPRLNTINSLVLHPIVPLTQEMIGFQRGISYTGCWCQQKIAIFTTAVLEILRVRELHHPSAKLNIFPSCMSIFTNTYIYIYMHVLHVFKHFTFMCIYNIHLNTNWLFD